jgi:carbonic anhydrase/acetyltransferase-like protein (isoleucine patch superfamily)
VIRSFEDTQPEIAESAYVDPEATVIGDVTVGPEATVLPGAVLRGDGGGQIILERRANVQDNATIHADTPGQQVALNENAAVGHNAIVHNATVGAHSLVGMNATALDNVTVEPYSVVAANSLVTEGQRVPENSVVAGTPAEVMRDNLDRDSDLFRVAKVNAKRVEGLREGTVTSTGSE